MFILSNFWFKTCFSTLNLALQIKQSSKIHSFFKCNGSGLGLILDGQMLYSARSGPISLEIETFFSLRLLAPSFLVTAWNEWCYQLDEIITFPWSVRDGPDQANKKQKIFVLSHQNLISFFFNLLQTLLHQSFPLFQRMSKLQLKIFVKGEERVCMEDFLYVQLIIFSHFPKNVNH